MKTLILLVTVIIGTALLGSGCTSNAGVGTRHHGVSVSGSAR